MKKYTTKAKIRRLTELVSRPFYFEQTQEELLQYFECMKGAPEQICRPAVRHPDGMIYSGLIPARHGEVIFFMAIKKRAGIKNTRAQGFITTHGRFVNRVEALAIATARDQIIKKHPSYHELYTEDVW